MPLGDVLSRFGKRWALIEVNRHERAWAVFRECLRSRELFDKIRSVAKRMAPPANREKANVADSEGRETEKVCTIAIILRPQKLLTSYQFLQQSGWHGYGTVLWICRRGVWVYNPPASQMRGQ